VSLINWKKSHTSTITQDTNRLKNWKNYHNSNGHNTDLKSHRNNTKSWSPWNHHNCVTSRNHLNVKWNSSPQASTIHRYEISYMDNRKALLSCHHDKNSKTIFVLEIYDTSCYQEFGPLKDCSCSSQSTWNSHSNQPRNWCNSWREQSGQRTLSNNRDKRCWESDLQLNYIPPKACAKKHFVLASVIIIRIPFGFVKWVECL
jgi:hypothetical protein